MVGNRRPYFQFLADERLRQRVAASKPNEPTTEAPPPDNGLLAAAERLREHILIGAGLDDASRDRLMASDPYKTFSRIVRAAIPMEERESDLYGNDLRHDQPQIDTRGDII